MVDLTEFNKVKEVVSPDEEFDNSGGKVIRFYFKNGYGVSCACHSFSYGSDEGLLEAAVLKDGELCYDTEITDDVLGSLNARQVLEVIDWVKGL